MSSFTSTGPDGKQSVTKVDDFAPAAAYRRNAVGTGVCVALIALLVLMTLQVLTVVAHKMRLEFSAGVILDYGKLVSLLTTFVILTFLFWLCVTFYNALTKPEFLLGDKSDRNLRPFRFYFYFVVGTYALAVLASFITAATGKAEMPTLLMVVNMALTCLSTIFVPLVIYFSWRQKNHPHSFGAKLLMPFVSASPK